MTLSIDERHTDESAGVVGNAASSMTIGEYGGGLIYENNLTG
jgi:hypothetical protein